MTWVMVAVGGAAGSVARYGVAFSISRWFGNPVPMATALVNVAGCAITSGRVVKGKIRIRRRKDIMFEGHIQSLRRFQDEVNEVRAGMECGIRIDGFNDFQIGDVIEAYTVEKVPAKL